MNLITTKELKKLIDSEEDYVLIDVRESSELGNGMIPTAVNVPLFKIIGALENYDKESRLIFYCRTGTRSEKATQIAIGLGFKNAKNYKGSIWEWSLIDDNVKRYGPESLH